MPFMDTHVAVRFLGGVSNFTEATDPGCVDRVGPPASSGVDRPGIWCDLVTRDKSTGQLRSRFDLVQSRLDRFVLAGMDVLIVLDNVPWAFLHNRTYAGPCQNYGCQYLPPDDPHEFAEWVGELAAYIKQVYGEAFASRVRWRLGTEANGPRWSDRGRFFHRYLESYQYTAAALRRVLPAAQFGASNWVEVVGNSGNLTRNGSDSFQHHFYSRIGASDTPLDFISVSHYGGGGRSPNSENFPNPDWVQRTPGGKSGQVELEAMRQSAQRPQASLEVMEWSILTNELRQPTWEPSSVGTAWSAASATAWMCHGVDRIFHWETGTSLRNSTGDNRIVYFYEQWPWNMAFLELFLGGKARFSTFDQVRRGHQNRKLGMIESVVNGTYYALVAIVGSQRNDGFTTEVKLSTNAFQDGGQKLQIEQYQMDSSVSVVETIVRELHGQPGMLLHNDSLPYDIGRLLTPQGVKYAEAPENLERYWKMHANTFKPSPYRGSWQRSGDKIEFAFDAKAYSVVVIAARRA